MKAVMLGTWHVHAHDYARGFTGDERCELTAVWDADPAKAETFAAKYGAKPYSDLDKLYAEEEFEAVLICTATNEHVPIMAQAAKAGKHIFTEKVLAITTEGALEIAEAVKESGVKFVISYPHKCNPGLMAMKQIIDDGKLGTLTYARVRNAHNGSIADWLPPHFYDKEQCGGGAMMDLGAHPMYLLLWFLGEPENVASAFTNITDRAVEDNAVSILSYKNGAIGVSETGFVSNFGNYSIEIHGTEGSLRHIDGVTQMASKATEGKWENVELPEAPKNPLGQWIDYVIDGTPAPEFGVEEAVQLTKLMVAAYKGSETGAAY